MKEKIQPRCISVILNLRHRLGRYPMKMHALSMEPARVKVFAVRPDMPEKSLDKFAYGSHIMHAC